MAQEKRKESPDFFEIRINGQAVISRPAERAKIDVHVSSTGNNKAAVSDDVLTATKHIETLLEEIAPTDDSPEEKAASPLAHYNKSSLSSTSHIPASKGKTVKPRVYDASVKFDIRFKEFNALGSFASRLSSMPNVEVRGIEWLLTTETTESFQSQLRKDAARDALAKVMDYCEILQCHNVRAIELQEGGAVVNRPSYGTNFGGYHVQQPGAMSRTRQTARINSRTGTLNDDGTDLRDESDLSFKPESVRLSLSVTVTFHADPRGRNAHDGSLKRRRMAEDDEDMGDVAV